MPTGAQLDLHYETVCFGRYRFEPRTARLWADEREIKLTRKAAAVLGLLVACAGRPVTKAELFASVWSDRVVSDDALTTCIQELRKALGDDRRQPRYIETRHRSGYQLVAALSRAAGSATPAPGVAALAVLPFTDMSAARDQEYFCEGLAEEMIDALANVDGLCVAARNACGQFRGPGLDIQQAGRQLGVEALLVGSVRRDGERLRIMVQLIEVASGYHKWSQRFERTLGDVFAIQDEIAQTVATILRGGALRGRESFPLLQRQRRSDAFPRNQFEALRLVGRRVLPFLDDEQSLAKAGTPSAEPVTSRLPAPTRITTGRMTYPSVATESAAPINGDAPTQIVACNSRHHFSSVGHRVRSDAG